MRRVCHIVQSYYPRDPRIRRQAEALVEAGFEVDVVCLRGEKEKKRETVNGVGVYRLPLSRRRAGVLRYLFEYAAFFVLASIYMVAHLRRGYSLIHVSNMPDFLVFAALVPKLFGVTVILDEHDPMPELFMAKYGVTERDRLIRLVAWQERVSVRFSHYVLTVSGAMRQRLERVAGKVPVSVVMNLPDDRLFQPVERRALEVDSDPRFVLLYAGTVSKQYGLVMVVEAVARLKARIPGLYFKIAGDGDDLMALRSLAENLGVADIVEFLGDVPFSRIPVLIADCDIGVSTLRRDAMTDLFFTNKAVEYVMMGLPAVVARTSVVEGHFPDGILQFYEPDDQASFEDAITKVYEDSDMRDEMIRKGLAFSKTSNWSVEKLKYISLVERLTGRDA